jgi:hypothetical protein
MRKGETAWRFGRSDIGHRRSKMEDRRWKMGSGKGEERLKAEETKVVG